MLYVKNALSGTNTHTEAVDIQESCNFADQDLMVKVHETGLNAAVSQSQ